MEILLFQWVQWVILTMELVSEPWSPDVLFVTIEGTKYDFLNLYHNK